MRLWGVLWVILCLGWLALAQPGPQSRLFVANCRSNAVTVYPLEAEGDQPPLRMIFGNQTELECPQSLASDGLQLWVGNQQSVAVFGLNDAGNVKPRRLLQGPKTGISLARGLLVHQQELFVACSSPDSIRVFSTSSEGDCKPLRVIEGQASLLANPQGLAIQGDQLLVANEDGNQLLLFSLRAEGNVPPQEVWGRDRFRLFNPRGLARDQSGRLALVGDGGLLVFLQDGHLSRSLLSSELSGSIGVCCHQDQTWVANYTQSTAAVFGTQGQDALRVLRGRKTLLRGPTGILVAPAQ